MSEYVLRIHLFDQNYQRKLETIEVNEHVDLPSWIEDDRPKLTLTINQAYELKGRIISHAGTEAQYTQATAPATQMRTSLTYILQPPFSGLQSLVNSYGNWNMFKPSQAIVYSKPFTVNWVDEAPFGQSVIEHLNGLSAEPECKCDIRALLGNGHDTGCAYIQWKRGRNVSNTQGK